MKTKTRLLYSYGINEDYWIDRLGMCLGKMVIFQMSNTNIVSLCIYCTVDFKYGKEKVHIHILSMQQ